MTSESIQTMKEEVDSRISAGQITRRRRKKEAGTFLDHKNAQVKKTKNMGQAVFAKAKIKKGSLVAKFDGPILDKNFEPWTKDLLSHAIQLGPELWRDSIGIARYINHSCEANCGIKNFCEIVAMRDIEKGEEITWDYEMTEKSWWFKMKCKCGAPSCRKVIGNYSRMPKATRKRYRGFISGWLLGRKFKELS